MNDNTSEHHSDDREADQFPEDFVVEDHSVENLLTRVAKLERRNRIVMYIFSLFVVVVLISATFSVLNQNIIVQQKLMESKELTLIDSQGNARLFIRMFSRVPVLQILDANGKPRMSMGLRFDDTPFIDLSDRKGNTRATLEITSDDSPALTMFNKNGDTTFTIN